MKALNFLIAGTLLLAPSVATAAPLEGLWANPKGDVIVRIAPCGPTLCGRVIHATQHAKEKAAKQGTQLLGSTLLSDVQPAVAGKWKAKVFVPSLGKRVSGNLSLPRESQLKVEGCVIGFVCKSQVWTRIVW
jgi:uncharacterized protein (DUF2147 family)